MNRMWRFNYLVYPRRERGINLSILLLIIY